MVGKRVVWDEWPLPGDLERTTGHIAVGTERLQPGAHAHLVSAGIGSLP